MKDDVEELVQKAVDPTWDESENTRRGKSAIFWAKAVMIIAVILGVFNEIFSTCFPNASETMGSNQNLPPVATLLSLCTLLLLIPLGLCFIMAMYKGISWIYHAVEEQRQFSKTKFSPSAALICTIIPILNPLFDYLIFKDLLSCQKETFKRFNLDFKDVPEKILKSILFLGLATSIFTFTQEYAILRILSMIIGVIVLLSYIKAMRIIIENAQLLQTTKFNAMLNQKVEEIIAQRKAESIQNL